MDWRANLDGIEGVADHNGGHSGGNACGVIVARSVLVPLRESAGAHSPVASVFFALCGPLCRLFLREKNHFSIGIRVECLEAPSEEGERG